MIELRLGCASAASADAGPTDAGPTAAAAPLPLAAVAGYIWLYLAAHSQSGPREELRMGKK